MCVATGVVVAPVSLDTESIVDDGITLVFSAAVVNVTAGVFVGRTLEGVFSPESVAIVLTVTVSVVIALVGPVNSVVVVAVI